MPSMNRKQFLSSFVYAVEEDFRSPFTGEEAVWANPDAPQIWGMEEASIKYPPSLAEVNEEEDREGEKGKRRARGVTSALSDDERLLAVGLGERVWIISVEDQCVRSELVGHTDNVGRIRFRPSPTTTSPPTLSAETETAPETEPKAPHGYTLLTCANEISTLSNNEPRIYFWNLTPAGTILDILPPPLPVHALAKKAEDAIFTDLVDHYTTSTDPPNPLPFPILPLFEPFRTAIETADREYRLGLNSSIEGGFASLSSTPFSPDGKMMAVVRKGRTTQSGEREEGEMPRVVVWDVERRVEKVVGRCGDSIMWIGWGIGEAAGVLACNGWDGVVRVWDVGGEGEDARLRWQTEASGGQNWTAAFSPDGRWLAASEKKGMRVRVYRTQDGELVREYGRKLGDWVRNMAWHGEGRWLAFAVEQEVVVWDVFGGEGKQEKAVTGEKKGPKEKDGEEEEKNNGKEFSDKELNVATRFRLQAEGMFRSFSKFQEVTWVDCGRKLLIRASDGTIELWDAHENKKWRFMKPQGVSELNYSSNAGVYLIRDDSVLLSVDGDNTVRFWKL
ncbi:prolyl oligopeptidase [Saccharata proteae CBS 121410]|uniref:Prolyl oligopeptidase n=1 Tax=Saccharata proteae CBS 121410 TaxID=1314787 RepID=A0A9P4LWU0_9PEZI|nr:prolyl oligopeptidase [Saccharata proteae CBS 121410]